MSAEPEYEIVRYTFSSLCFLFSTFSASAETLLGRVVNVNDGDTVTVLDTNRAQHRVRLSGIDAPEKRQSFGERSKQHLAALVFKKEVQVEWNRRDKYQRIVGKVVVPQTNKSCISGECQKTIDASLTQLTAGLAWVYRKYEHELSPDDRARYVEAERNAQGGKVGLWRDSNPMPPWEWRGSYPRN